MSGTGKTDRTVAITDSLWETLEEMSTQMGVERDALVNQAIFALARFHGYATPGHVEAAAKKPEPPPEKVEMSPLLTSAKLATPGTASEFDEPEPEPEAEPTPAPAKVPKAATARSSRIAKAEPAPAPEPEAVPSKRASQRVRSINAEVDRQVRVPAKAAAASEFDDELDAAKAEADAEEQEQAEPEAPADSGETPAGEPEEQAAPEQEAEAEAEPDQEEAPAEPEEAPAPAEAAAPSGDDDDLPDDAKTQARSSKKDEEAEAEPEPEGEGEIYLQVEGGEPVLMATDRFLIGRGKHCDLVLLSNRVSREHAIVHRKNKEIVLEDLNSSNGTWMDQKRIAKRTLNDGDTFTCGNVRVHCDFGGRSRA